MSEQFPVHQLDQTMDSPAVQHRPDFTEREAERGTHLVYMNDTSGIITAAEGEEQRIATSGLGGCTAVAMTVELPDGTRDGYIQHYSFYHGFESEMMLADAISRIPKNTQLNARVVIMTPGKGVHASGGSRGLRPAPAEGALVESLTAITQKSFEGQADVQVYPYLEIRDSSRDDLGTLVVELPAGGGAKILADAIPM